jgi:phospholipid/cholesterol/gamma-HCH transport system permease protein
MSVPPNVRADGEAQFALSGDWTIEQAGALSQAASQLVNEGGAARSVKVDLAPVENLDTAGALLINRARAGLMNAGVQVDFAGANDVHAALLAATPYEAPPTPPAREPFLLHQLAEVGENTTRAGKDFASGIGFLGRTVSTFIGLVARPGRWRPTSIVYHLEKYSWRSAPIVMMITFLVGCIVSQQGIFQFSKFGTPQYVVDLIGVLVLRELGVLLTAIMIAGRCGSAITAEIGAMKMREEVDALLVMGLDPMDTLVTPRLIALVIAMPLLTFLADISAVAGGLLVAAVYGGLPPDVFIYRLQQAVGVNTFMVGIIKAPFMALIIGLIATAEGFAVGGSAESLGSKVTESVVKSIFMVIALDGIFAVFFAAVRY